VWADRCQALKCEPDQPGSRLVLTEESYPLPFRGVEGVGMVPVIVFAIATHMMLHPDSDLGRYCPERRHFLTHGSLPMSATRSETLRHVERLLKTWKVRHVRNNRPTLILRPCHPSDYIGLWLLDSTVLLLALTLVVALRQLYRYSTADANPNSAG
jgi:hypothetical protein